MPAWSCHMGESSIESHLAELQIAELPSVELLSAESLFEEPPSEELSSEESSFVDHTTSSLLNPALSSSPNRTTSPYLDRAEPQPQLSSPCYSPFDHLPMELFQLIISFLPPLAAASLSLTCRSAQSIIRTKYFDQLQGKDWRKRRLEFLHLLARGLPTHIVCIACETLHSRTQKQLHKATPCKKADLDSLVSRHIHPDFDTITFLLAMKRHHSGLDPSALLSRLSGSRTVSETDHTHHWESTVRIVNGHLLLRHEAWYNFPDGANKMSITNLDTCACPDQYGLPYTDPRFPGSEYPAGYPVISALSRLTRLALKLACRASHWDDADRNASCKRCAGLIQCMFCPTEFQIEAKVFAEKGVALILTRWMDLGDGSVGDKRYASRLRGYMGRPVKFVAGTIMAAFEWGGWYGEVGGSEVSDGDD